MLNLHDLNIEREIIPLFNHTNNGNSRESLPKLLLDLPESATGILNRQAILKGFLANTAALEHFTFHRIEIEEVYLLFRKAAKEKTGFRAPQ